MCVAAAYASQPAAVAWVLVFSVATNVTGQTYCLSNKVCNIGLACVQLGITVYRYGLNIVSCQLIV